ncbi:nucleolar protein 8 [Aphanomyces cochlioides]|nr:nucleolar protein 8 [Aphanomyces cochlioides]
MSNSNASDFAYVEIQSSDPDAEAAAAKALVNGYHNTKWKGKRLRVEPALADYMARLQAEWNDAEAQKQELEAARQAALRGGTTTSTDLTLKPSKRFKGSKTTFDEEGNAILPVAPPKHTPEVGSADDDVSSESSDEIERPATAEELSSESSDEEMEPELVPATVAKKRLEDLSSESSDEEEQESAVPEPKSKTKQLELSSESSDDDDDDDIDEIATKLSSPAKAATTTSPSKASVSPKVAPSRPVLDEETSSDSSDSDASPAKPASSIKTEMDRREEANKRRLAALAEKQALAAAAASKAKAVVVAASANKKITFDSDGDEDADENAAEERAQKSKKSLFGDSDDEDDDEEDGLVSFRPEFAGPEGKKLFEMQKRFGGDDRFRLDERFMDEFAADDDDSGDANQDVDDTIQTWRVLDEADVAAQAAADKAEQLRALELLQELFPDMKIDKTKWTLLEDAAPDQKQLGWLASMRRYDPRDEATAKTMEQQVEPEDFPHEAPSDEETSAKKKWVDAPLPPPSEERYFAATTELLTMFSRVRSNSEDGEAMEAALDGVGGKPATSSVFSFAAMFEPQQEDNKPDDKDLKEKHHEDDDDDDASRAWHFTDGLFNRDDDKDESTDGEEDNEEHADNDDEKATAAGGAAVLKRPIQEVLAFGATFHKPEWTPQRETEWIALRKTYTVDFRRKHKQAIKNRKQAKKQHAKK